MSIASTNQLASDWMHRGIDLLNEGSVVTLEKAVRCFDEAIALRRTLPLDENDFFRYGLSAGWINRGDALANLGGKQALAEAVKSYDEALVLLESLPLPANMLYPRRLAIAWINRGIALQKQDASAELWEAMECFREDIAVLEHSSVRAISDLVPLQAGAWTNLPGALAGGGEAASADARAAARKALALTRASERTDLVMAEAALKARRAFCSMVVRDIANKRPLPDRIIAEAMDGVGDAMALSRHWKAAQHPKLAGLTLEIFRFGCRIHEHSQPDFLADFLLQHLDPEKSSAPLYLDPETIVAVRATILSVLESLQVNGFEFVATSRFEPLLSGIQQLRRVEECLDQVAKVTSGRR